MIDRNINEKKIKLMLTYSVNNNFSMFSIFVFLY